jgi:hypothetical protein
MDHQGNGTDAVVQVLLRIETGMAALEQATTSGFASVNQRLDRTNARLDNVLLIAGERSRELEARVISVEERLRRAGL